MQLTKSKKSLALTLAVLLLTGCSTPDTMNHTENTTAQEETMDWTDIENVMPALVKNAIRMKTGGEASSPLSSRIGGNPAVPADFRWPYYEGETWDGIRENRPLSFLCQINLADAAEFDKDGLLPDCGMLSVFYELATMKWGYDPEDRGCVRVFWFEDVSALTEREAPDGTVDQNGEEVKIPVFPIVFSSEANLPSVPEYMESSGLDFREVYDARKAAAEKLELPPYEDPSGITKLLGYADLIQNDILSEAELVSRGYYLGDGEYREKMTDAEYADAMAHREDWVLLMQIGTVGGYPDFELMWGDMGCLYILIRKDDLAARNFDNVWLLLQCG